MKPNNFDLESLLIRRMSARGTTDGLKTPQSAGNRLQTHD